MAFIASPLRRQNDLWPPVMLRDCGCKDGIFHENCDVWSNQYESRWCTHCWYQVWQWLRGVSCCKFLKKVKIISHANFFITPFANCQERTRLARDGVAEHCEWFRWQKQDPYLDEQFWLSFGFFLQNLGQIKRYLSLDSEDCKALLFYNIYILHKWIYGRRTSGTILDMILVILFPAISQMILPQAIPLSPTSSNFKILLLWNPVWRELKGFNLP